MNSSRYVTALCIIALILVPLASFSKEAPSGFISQEFCHWELKDFQKMLEEGEKQRIFFKDVQTQTSPASPLLTAPQFIEKEFVTLNFAKKYLAPILYYQIMNSGVHFDCILTIPRGGLLLSQLLGYMMDLNNLELLSAKSYISSTGIQQQELVMGEIPNLSKYTNVLVVDDVVDSGKTMKTIITKLKEHYPQINFYTAVGHHKPETAIFQPDFYAFVQTHWIIYEWEGVSFQKM